MVEQSNFPEKWSCTSDDKDVRVDVRVVESVGPFFRTRNSGSTVVIETQRDVENLIGTVRVSYGSGDSESILLNIQNADQVFIVEDSLEYEFYGLDVLEESGNVELESANLFTIDWIEIPTTKVEQWIEKGDAAQIQRTAKVEFPTEWGELTTDVQTNSPKQLIEQFDNENPESVMHARVWWKDSRDNYLIGHYGWVGGVGQTGSANQSKMWVYDFAELLSGVPIGPTFDEMEIEKVVERITRLTNDNAPIPISDSKVLPPETEEEFTITARQFKEGGFGITGRQFVSSPFVDDEEFEFSPFANTQVYSLSDEETIGTLESIPQRQEDLVNLPKPVGENYEATVIRGEGFDLGSLTDKSFDKNRTTLQDVYDWFEKKTASTLRFEPRENSVQLVADITPERRRFVQEEIIEGADDDFTFHEAIDVLVNDALYEITPLNTIRVNGAVGGLSPRNSAAVAPFSIPRGADFENELYPTAKATAPALIQATEDADGNTYELSTIVESDSDSLDQVEREARRELAKRLEKIAEGSILLRGEPHLMPFDRVESYEVCQGQVEYDAPAIPYEVESVKHQASVDEEFRTDVRVSIWANDVNIEVTSSPEEA